MLSFSLFCKGIKHVLPIIELALSVSEFFFPGSQGGCVKVTGHTVSSDVSLSLA